MRERVRRTFWFRGSAVFLMDAGDGLKSVPAGKTDNCDDELRSLHNVFRCVKISSYAAGSGRK